MGLVVKTNPFQDQLPTPSKAIDVADYRELYDSYKRVIIRVLMGRGLSPDDAEDVTHEAFVKLLSLDALKSPDYLRPYLFKIATNLAIDLLRRRNRSPEIDSDETKVEVENKHDCLPSPEDMLHFTQTLENIAEVLNELPDKCQQAFLFYKIRGYDYAEVAKMLKVSESMVRKYVLRAIRHCYDRLQETI